MWNVVDFTTNSLYVATVSLRLVAYYRVQVRELSWINTLILYIVVTSVLIKSPKTVNEYVYVNPLNLRFN